MNITPTNLRAKVTDAEAGNLRLFMILGTGEHAGLDFRCEYLNDAWTLETFVDGESALMQVAPNGEEMIKGVLHAYDQEESNASLH